MLILFQSPKKKREIELHKECTINIGLDFTYSVVFLSQRYVLK